jgi:uncharacterized protein (AIM24 family)
MDTGLQHIVTRLERGAMLRLNVIGGRVVAVFNGLVWITQEGDPRDVLVASGESFAIDRPGVVLLEAFESTVLTVFDAHTRHTADEVALA